MELFQETDPDRLTPTGYTISFKYIKNQGWNRWRARRSLLKTNNKKRIKSRYL